MIKLSIITPYYKTLRETLLLGEILYKQLTEEVEWIIVDDGCQEYELDKLQAKVIHSKGNSGNASRPRNIGLDNAQGEFITFIDSDDQVTDTYVKDILNKIDTDKFDYCFFSWRTLKEPHWTINIIDMPPAWNQCVWNCIYSKNLIGDNRFREDLSFAEDSVFNLAVRKGVKANLNKILYIYNSGREDSLSDKHGKEKKS